MNYQPGQKVKVSVNGAEWEDEVECIGGTHGDDILTYCLKSGIEAPTEFLTPIEPEIKPEPVDIVSVWEDDDYVWYSF